MDTQWPRYEVFEKERPDWPHRNAGSVHAPDAEMALENARDVFVRRPHCLSLWVAPASEIFSMTAEQLAGFDWRSVPAGPDSEPYLVFQKQTQRAAETFVVHVGEVEARSHAEAMSHAVEKFGSGGVFVWWVCPARAVTRSEESDVSAMFAPSESKPYRQPHFYKVIAQLREIKSKASE
ncbi:MAG: phenylacetic acid degradation protein [Chloroflexi bacterium]|nr:phenylacetic acid degradation protein [Chloroflexota bacterium]